MYDKIPTLNNILNTDNVNEQVDIFATTFVNCLDSCAPVVTKIVHRPPAPWMNDDIRNEMHNRNLLRRRRDLTNDDIVNDL